MKDFLETQLPAIITGILGLGAYLFERRRKTAEIQQVEGDAIQAMQNAYKTFVNDSKTNYMELKIKVDKLDSEVLLWKAKYFELKNRINQIDKNDTDIPPTD